MQSLTKNFLADKHLKKERRLICEKCDFNILNLCKKCGCIIPAKTKLLNSKCPLEKW